MLWEGRNMGRRILFISKYPEIVQEFLDAMRDREDIEIDTAGDGKEAALLLKKKEYQIVVTGLTLEWYNGEQLITYVNKNFPNTVCIIYTTTISTAQLQFFMNKRDVFRIFLRPVNFRMEFLEALDEAFEYYDVRLRDNEEEQERKAQLEHYRKSIVDMECKLNAQKKERDDMARYMKKLMTFSMEEYAGRLTAEGKRQLKELECEVVDMSCGQDGELKANLPKAEIAVQKIHELLEDE